jgi:hypothetical protein
MRMVGFVNVLVQAIVFQWGSRERKENEYRGLDSGQALVLYLGQMLNKSHFHDLDVKQDSYAFLTMYLSP